ncbi:hypothetical protein PV336_16220 [Streptomyces sp. MI02-2A]|uniref:hypothetical protein n=1 Tax=Streptomyces sp. MI02-2A TaxID=3028688 RepID=UPI0029B784FA|nr:hypothetical protein [Streptomyces sp. MI02-2A]MDX3260767.1 hypothetical protein [Streptomyces sp. MI02-2A]
MPDYIPTAYDKALDAMLEAGIDRPRADELLLAVCDLAIRNHEIAQERVPDNPKGPGEVTYADVHAYPYYYIRGEGREAADASRCEHDYRLTSSCPGCP